MSRRRIVAIVGIDGSGKSTQAKALAAYLSAGGRPAVYFENPGGRPFIAKVARALGRADGIELLGRYGYLAVEATVRGIFLSRALIWSRLTGRIAVMDRFTVCQYALMRARGDRGERVVRALYRIFPAPDVTVLMVVPPALACQRVAARGIDTEDADYLAACDRGYAALPESRAWIVLDAAGSVEEVAERVAAVVLGRLPAGETRLRSRWPSERQM